VRTCRALTGIHSADPVASDLKPENLLLDDDFRIKVTDFGTGKLIDVPRLFLHFVHSEKASCYLAERATKTFVGTAQYVSPELLEANETSKRYEYSANSVFAILMTLLVNQFGLVGPGLCAIPNDRWSIRLPRLVRVSDMAKDQAARLHLS
jgi:3-phosphoinositide dependent protein kinase-1